MPFNSSNKGTTKIQKLQDLKSGLCPFPEGRVNAPIVDQLGPSVDHMTVTARVILSTSQLGTTDA